MTKYYHVTPTENEVRVYTLGLFPPGHLKSFDGTPYFEPVHISEDSPFDSFISDLYGNVWVAIFEVDLSGLLSRAKEGFDGPGTLAIYEWVEPWRLTFIAHTREPSYEETHR